MSALSEVCWIASRRQRSCSVAAADDHAELAVADVQRVAGRERAGEVGRHVIVALDDRVAAVDQLAGDRLGVDVARADPLAAGEEARQRRRDVALAVVEAGPVGLAAVVGVAELEGGLGVPRAADADREEGFVGRRLGGEVDHAAAELARDSSPNSSSGPATRRSRRSGTGRAGRRGAAARGSAAASR